ncbi:MAG: TlyA family RNA methyltransferase [Acidimicrobiaceae bacterium]|nr:TlyA family RNA methyltransferase [Acidimicrobiaceae bacterium]MDE0517260.1 TlyA family RNA methyltransferase [Acidimicrobiaceae bacterium]MDE0656292.1 TlyA family RNA methyltransferase [Acidimicrobiaceae bacterium]
MTPRRRRLDIEMVRRGLAGSRTEAQRLVEERRVTVGGSVAAKASRLVDPAEPVMVKGDPPRYVSRGGHKLEAALAGFGVAATGCRAIDVGASTGGFTDCLLQHGAAAVAAIDVGRNQLHERLRADPRVASFERTDVRAVTEDAIGGPAELVVADVSFISLRLVMADLCRLATADIIVLVKPQFEAGRADADRGRGVIRDPEVWRRALLGACRAVVGAGAAIMGVMVSPLTGAEGNVEFLLHADVHRDAEGLADADTAVDRAVADAIRLAGG